MDEKILKLYLEKSGTEYSLKAIWKKKSWLDRAIYLIFIATMMTTLSLLIGGMFSETLLKAALISMLPLIFSIAVFSFSEKKNNTLKMQIEKNINKRSMLKKVLIDNGVDDEKKIKMLYNRLEAKYKKHEATVAKTTDMIYGAFKVLVIPAFLAFFNQILEQDFTSSNTVSMILMSSLLVLVLLFCVICFYRVYDIIAFGHYVDIEMFLSLLDDVLGFEDCNPLTNDDLI